jgi:hypothetical protein
LRVVEIENLAEAFAKHAAACSSSVVLCSVRVAFESWFRLELAYTMHTHINGDISFDYSYEGTSNKADLLLTLDGRKVVFELKSFAGSDANKLAKFPGQINSIRTEVDHRRVEQGVAFCTFTGYTSDRMNDICRKFFQPPWQTTKLLPILADKPLRFMLASVVLPSEGP